MASTASHRRGWLSAGNLWLLSCLTLGVLAAVWVTTRPAPAANRAAVPVTRTAAGKITVAPIDRKIEAAQVGMAAWSHNPTGEEDLQFGDYVDPATWKHLILRSQKADGSYCDINLLRPDWWLEDEAAERGGTIYVSVPECGIDGEAEVVDIRRCPPIQPCPPGYRTITGTFHHQNAKVIDLYIEGLAEPIGTTPNHPFWSVDRQEFVRADELNLRERLATSDGLRQIIAISDDRRVDIVFNFEVQLTHAYCISHCGLIVHNGNPCPGAYVRHVVGGPQNEKQFLAFGLRRELDHFDEATGTGWEVTKINFNNTFDNLDDFEELRRKLIQLEKDAYLLRTGEVNKMIYAVPESLPNVGRGAEFTRMISEMKREGLNVEVRVIPLP